MRIIVIGAVDFTRHCLQVMIEQQANIVAVFTLEKQYSHRHSDFADLEPLTTRHDIPLYRVNKLNDHVDVIKELAPDVIFILGWSQLTSKAIWSLPPRGCIGSHPTLLPKNRGRHPLIWALVDGLSVSGLTFLYLDDGADTGDILWQQPFDITLTDTAADLYEKIKMLATQAITEFLPQLANGTAPRIPQDHSQATIRRKRGKDDGEIHWEQPSMTIYNLVRALTHPYPGAHTFLNGQLVKVWEVALGDETLSTQDSNTEPGTIFALADEHLAVRTGDGYLVVKSTTLEDGTDLQVGMRLGKTD